MAIILTNKYGISDAIVKACTIDNHVTIGDISVTQLLDAPQIRMLRMHNDYEEDVTDRIWALMGTAVHYVMELGEVKSSEARKILQAAEILMKHDKEKAANFMYKFVEEYYPDAQNPDVLNEVTLSYTMDDMTFSGTFDRFTISKGLLDDYKNTSVWAYTNPEGRKKWNAQQNTYAFLLRENGYTVNASQITAIFRDFSAARSNGKNYPNKPIETFPVKLVDHGIMKSFLRKRLSLHKQTQDGLIPIPDCTIKERWATSDTYAVSTPTRKMAIKVFDTEKAARAFLYGDGAKYKNAFVEKRIGTSKRCDNYCSFSNICPQNKKRLGLE